ncbi:YXWGXW repeat-containing protein [Bythopirellula goksoeyrii]|uniref:YXWGXW repeat (2 copies) n=1 Tax=Bythopirellula goksoeyrii TaxID=1400387 RepID=A0A5B9QHB9_9BACT|nr:YXWGXW repeat-containing protein [Bythopirellula goksoeyrii]QEG33621.1 hypothetical protein Pr1d_08850 [Bythopirellula goksoeyrii]
MSRISVIVGGLYLTSLIAFCDQNTASAQAPPAPAPQNMLPEPEVLDQGPIHEAFAEPLALGQGEAEVVTKQPPAPVQELPPDERPEGQNVEWIPGYFKFDQDREDFIWVSGLWRDVPPGRTWIPGEWQEVEGGWQWVPGFWSDAEQELRLLPVPPDSLEAGPSSPAPDDSYLWAPGCWQWQNTGYAWQAGFWYEAQPNWVWVPNHYSYTPRGCVFVNGYWDYPPQSRGWLYAPVYWGGGYAGYGRNYYYRPLSVINTGLLLANLFVDRNHGHYYYGYNRGRHPGWVQPWGANYSKYGHRGHGKGYRGGYDPLWAHHNFKGRDGNYRGGDRDGRDFNRGDRRDNDLAQGRDRANMKLVTSVDEFKKDYKNFDGKDRKIRQLSENEVSKARSQAKKYANFDRSRIGLDSKKDAKSYVNRDGNRAKLEGNANAEGRILRQGDGGSSQGKIRSQENVDVRNRSKEIFESRNRSRAELDARIGGSEKSEYKRGDRNSDIRSKGQVENRARVQSDGSQLDIGNSSKYRGSVNQRYQGSGQGTGSAQSDRQKLYYRGGTQEGTNQLQQLQQRSQQQVPNTRSFQGSTQQKITPQGNYRRSDSSNSQNIRSNSRSYQGSGQVKSGGQSSQRAIQQPRSSSPQNRSSYRSSGGSSRGGGSGTYSGSRGGGGGQRASGGNRGGGGGGKSSGGKKGR